MTPVCSLVEVEHYNWGNLIINNYKIYFRLIRDNATNPTETKEAKQEKNIDDWWSVVVVFGCFMIEFLSFGGAYTVSQFVVEWRATFNESVQKASLVGAINPAVMYLIGSYCLTF